VTIPPTSPDASSAQSAADEPSRDTATAAVPAGWYPDPEGHPRSRWWDGGRWTADFNVQFDEPMLADDFSEEVTNRVDEAFTHIRSVSTVWIWLAIIVPYAALPFISALTPLYSEDALAAQSGAGDSSAALVRLITPELVALVIIGFAAPWVTIFCAYRDWRWLERRGVVQPFHWAWSFMTLAGFPVYSFGRAIVTNRRTDRGIWVLWLSIAMFAISIAVSAVWVSSIGLDALR
jgi:hypothetical protein